MVILEDEEDLVSEDPSKQGRMTETEYEEVEYELDQTDTLPIKVTLEKEEVLSVQEIILLEVFLVLLKEVLSTDERIAQKLNEEEMAKLQQEKNKKGLILKKP
ncbi:hypothetical protein Tco_0361000 [Tanacetum coccineum]